MPAATNTESPAECYARETYRVGFQRPGMRDKPKDQTTSGPKSTSFKGPRSNYPGSGPD